MICHCEEHSGPEHSEGTHEIATGFTATTFGRIAEPFLPTGRQAGSQ